jgi:hypothetical protein
MCIILEKGSGLRRSGTAPGKFGNNEVLGLAQLSAVSDLL